MATIDYKDFALTDATVDDETSEEWGARENQLDEDIIDTMVADCISLLKDTAGHKHGKLYNIYGTKAIDTQTDTYMVTIGACDDYAATNKSVEVVIGTELSTFKVKDMNDIEFVSVDAAAGDILIASEDVDGVSIDKSARTVSVGAIEAANDKYGDSASVIVLCGHFGEESFVVEDVTSGAKPIVVDNVGSNINIGGTSHNVIIGGIDGGSIDLGNTGGNEVVVRLLREAGNSFRILEGDTSENTIMHVDTRSSPGRTVKIGAGTGAGHLPLTMDEDGKVYTRDVVAVDHTIYGMTSTTVDSVKIVSIGGMSFIHIDIDGTKDSSSDFFVTLPLASGLSLTDGKKIGTATGINNTTEVVVTAQYYQNNSVPGCDLHLIPIGGTPESSGWTGSQRCAVSIVIPFLLADPEFTNEIPT